MEQSQVVSRRAVFSGAVSVVIGGLAACRGDQRDGPDSSAVIATGQSTTVPESTAAPTTVPSANVGYFPSVDGEWETISPSEAGFTDAGIADVIELVGATNAQSFVMLHEGRILAEQYWKGATATTARDIASAQKSVTSTLLDRSSTRLNSADRR